MSMMTSMNDRNRNHLMTVDNTLKRRAFLGNTAGILRPTVISYLLSENDLGKLI